MGVITRCLPRSRLTSLSRSAMRAAGPGGTPTSGLMPYAPGRPPSCRRLGRHSRRSARPRDGRDVPMRHGDGAASIEGSLLVRALLARTVLDEGAASAQPGRPQATRAAGQERGFDGRTRQAGRRHLDLSCRSSEVVSPPSQHPVSPPRRRSGSPTVGGSWKHESPWCRSPSSSAPAFRLERQVDRPPCKGSKWEQGSLIDRIWWLRRSLCARDRLVVVP